MEKQTKRRLCQISIAARLLQHGTMDCSIPNDTGKAAQLAAANLLRVML